MVAVVPDRPTGVLRPEKRRRLSWQQSEQAPDSQSTQHLRRPGQILARGLRREAEHPRPLGVYFGSAADVRPALDFPEYNWVFVTPEPSHPVAAESYPRDTCGWCLGHTKPRHFYSMFLDRLGRREWVGVRTRALWYFLHRTTGQVLRVFINSTVEEVTEVAAKWCRQATAAYVMGFCPDVPTFKRLCPQVTRCWGPKHAWMGLDLYAPEVTIVEDGDWKPVDGEDFEAKTPRAWVFEPIPDIDAVEAPEERQALIESYMS